MNKLLFAGWLVMAAAGGLATTTNEIQQLVADLGADRFTTREAAQKQLLAIGAPAAPFLKEAVDSKDPEVRVRAREIIVQIGEGDIEKPDPQILAEVESLLQPVNNSGHANLNTIVAMGKRATPALVALVQRQDHCFCIYGMIALTRIDDPRSFPTLAEMFQRSEVAPHMSGYVSQMKNPRMLGELIKLWNKLGNEATEKLCEQVKKMSGQELGDDPAAYRKWFEEKHSDVDSNK